MIHLMIISHHFFLMDFEIIDRTHLPNLHKKKPPENMWHFQGPLFQGQQPYGSQQPFVSSQQASPV